MLGIVVHIFNLGTREAEAQSLGASLVYTVCFRTELYIERPCQKKRKGDRERSSLKFLLYSIGVRVVFKFIHLFLEFLSL